MCQVELIIVASNIFVTQLTEVNRFTIIFIMYHCIIVSFWVTFRWALDRFRLIWIDFFYRDPFVSGCSNADVTRPDLTGTDR